MSFNSILWNSIKNDKWSHFSYFLTGTFSVSIFYLFLSIFFHLSTESTFVVEFMNFYLLLSCFFIYTFSFILIVYSLSSLESTKQKEYGAFLLSGASKTQMQKFIFRKNLIIGFFSILIGLIIGMALLPLFVLIIKNILDFSNYTLHLPWKATLITFLSFFTLFLLSSLATALGFRKDHALNALNLDATFSAKSSKNYGRLTLFIGFTVFLLMSNQIFYSTILKIDIIYSTFLIPLAIIGLYFPISHGFNFFLSRVAKRKSYYQGTRILFINSLKQKKATYSKVIYLLTTFMLGIFLSSSFMYATFQNIESTITDYYPYTIQYVSLPDNSSKEESDDIDKIQSTFKNISPHTFDKLTYKTSGMSAYISLDAYNQLTFTKKITLENNQFILIRGGDEKDPSMKSLKNYYPDMSKKNSIDTPLLTPNLYYQYFILSNDQFAKIPLPTTNTFIFETSNWKKYKNQILTLLDDVHTTPSNHLITSKVKLYYNELYTKRLALFLCVFLGLIFFLAVISVIYLYLISSFTITKQRYQLLKSLGLSTGELRSLITKEIRILIFLPIILSSILFIVIISYTFTSFIFFENILLGLFSIIILLVTCYFIIRYSYLKRLDLD